MKLASVEIENFRAVTRLVLPLDSRLTVLHGANAHGKTSVLRAIAVGLGLNPSLFPGVVGVRFSEGDRRRGAKTMRVALRANAAALTGPPPRTLPRCARSR